MEKVNSSKHWRNMHRLSGMLISVFFALHLANHLYLIAGLEAHIKLMSQFRIVYRNIFVESILLLAVLFQTISGLRLFFKRRRESSKDLWLRMQLFSGLYLAIFFLIHVGAVLAGRFLFKLDTNFYFAAAGLNDFPSQIFFIPYYFLAVFSFFAHIASIHKQKMKFSVLGFGPQIQALTILAFGIFTASAIIWLFSNGFSGFTIPKAYQILVGK